jgi:hypothetical protein
VKGAPKESPNGWSWAHVHAGWREMQARTIRREMKDWGELYLEQLQRKAGAGSASEGKAAAWATQAAVAWAEHTLSAWRDYVVDAVVVRIKGTGTATVEVPVLRSHPGDGAEGKVNTFICALALLVFHRCRKWTGSAGGLQFRVGKHKAWTADIDGEVFWYKACESERPAFCICDEAGSELLHFYFAMGLEFQHGAIATPLARVRNSKVVLAALLGELSRRLPVVLQKEYIVFEVPESQRRKGTPDEVKKEILGLLEHLCGVAKRTPDEVNKEILTQLERVCGVAEPVASAKPKGGTAQDPATQVELGTWFNRPDAAGVQFALWFNRLASGGDAVVPEKKTNQQVVQTPPPTLQEAEDLWRMHCQVEKPRPTLDPLPDELPAWLQ